MKIKNILPAYKQILDLSPSPVCIQDLSGVYLYTNQSYQNMGNMLACNQSEQVDKQVVNNSIDAALIGSKPRYINHESVPKEGDSCPFKEFFPTIMAARLDVTSDFVITIFSRSERALAFCTKSIYQLTKQEGLVVEAIADGLCNKLIARAMNLSVHTVSGYTKAIYIKFGVRSRAELQFILSIIRADTKLELCERKGQKCSFKHGLLPPP